MSKIVTFNKNNELEIAEIESVREVARPFKNERCSQIIDTYLAAISDYQVCFNFAVPMLLNERRNELTKIAKVFDKFSKEVEINGEKHIVADGVHAAKHLRKAIDDSEVVINSKADEAIVKSLFIGLFSEYDHFLGELLKALYKENQELLKGISREISFNELVEFKDIDAVKSEMLDKEIDSLRRESYLSQFEALEKKFSIELRKFMEWPEFIEISQRRNLFTHNNGCVSQQYLTICKRVGYKVQDTVVVGSRLEISRQYFQRAVLILSKVGFYLAHTLWSKCLPDKSKLAGDALNNSIFNLLKREQWELATDFGVFGLNQAHLKNVDDITKKIRVINTAIGLLNLKKKKEAIDLLNQHDWTSSIRDLKLAVSILKEEYAKSCEIMKEIGKTGELINEISYHEWPIFRDFNKTDEFKIAYKDIYGISFDDKVTEEASIQSEKVRNESDELGSGKQKKKIKIKSKRTIPRLA